MTIVLVSVSSVDTCNVFGVAFVNLAIFTKSNQPRSLNRIIHLLPKGISCTSTKSSVLLSVTTKVRVPRYSTTTLSVELTTIEYIDALSLFSSYRRELVFRSERLIVSKATTTCVIFTNKEYPLTILSITSFTYSIQC